MPTNLIILILLLLTSCGPSKIELKDAKTIVPPVEEGEIGHLITAQLHFASDYEDVEVRTMNYLKATTSIVRTNDRSQFNCKIGETVEFYIGSRKLLSAYCQRDIFLATSSYFSSLYETNYGRVEAVAAHLYYLSTESSTSGLGVRKMAQQIYKFSGYEEAGFDPQGFLLYVYNQDWYTYLYTVRNDAGQGTAPTPVMPDDKDDVIVEMLAMWEGGLESRYETGTAGTLLSAQMTALGGNGGTKLLTGELIKGPTTCSPFLTSWAYFDRVPGQGLVTKPIFTFGFFDANLHTEKTDPWCDNAGTCSNISSLLGKLATLGRTTEVLNPDIDESISGTYGFLRHGSTPATNLHFLAHLVISPDGSNLLISGGFSIQNLNPADITGQSILSCDYRINQEQLILEP